MGFVHEQKQVLVLYPHPQLRLCHPMLSHDKSVTWFYRFLGSSLIHLQPHSSFYWTVFTSEFPAEPVPDRKILCLGAGLFFQVVFACIVVNWSLGVLHMMMHSQRFFSPCGVEWFWQISDNSLHYMLSSTQQFPISEWNCSSYNICLSLKLHCLCVLSSVFVCIFFDLIYFNFWIFLLWIESSIILLNVITGICSVLTFLYFVSFSSPSPLLSLLSAVSLPPLVSTSPPDANPQLCGVPVLLPTWAERLFPPGPPPGTNEWAVSGRGRPLPRDQPQQQVGCGGWTAWNSDHESSPSLCIS